MCNIILLYVIVCENIKTGANTGRLVMMFSVLMTFLVPILLISRAGQRVHDNADGNRRALVKLLNRAQPADANFPILRRLTDVTCTQRVTITLFGSVRVGHALLPGAFAFLATYLINGLQFNSIL
ncbi:uncharacterized protein LOC125489765 [Plutella xylostella]|uniref:uncharacterized protein LOC125489765 n=1 Tax=Plutella xylostella TaxID=51655 RepID=UPI0020327F96|nr:uncharacterized protein LOC125489765 [Plutella xylostella]